MKQISINNVPKEALDNWPLFTGKVFRQSAIKETDGSEITIDYIHFPKGIRNKFHSHTNDQILIVTQGKGIVATEKETFNAKEGDIFYIPAGEKHWHGATDHSDFTHISIIRKGAKFTQFEK